MTRLDRINSEQDVDRALNELLKADLRLIRIADAVDSVPLRRIPHGFPGLVEIVVFQHVSKKSAASVLRRLCDHVQPMTPDNLLARGKMAMVAAGLTRAKQQTLINVAEAYSDGFLCFDDVYEMLPADARELLMSIKGIGPWTADVYLLSCAGHADVFPAGDVALRHAVHIGLNLPNRPAERELRELAEKNWSPWQSVAARLFWAYYARIQGS